MRSILLSIFLSLICLLSITANAQSISPKPFKPKKIKFKARQLTTVTKVDSGYDPNLLIPHYDEKSKKWGYIHRTTHRLIVPHTFDRPSTQNNGKAYPLKINSKKGIDVYLVENCNAAKLIFEDTLAAPTSPPDASGHTIRFHDDYIFVQRGETMAVISPDGKTRIDTIAPSAGQPFQYLGNGSMILEYPEAMVLLSFQNKTYLRFDSSQFHFPALDPWEKSNYKTIFQFFEVLRKEDQKIGVFDDLGTQVADFVWDLPPANQLLTKDRETYKYHFSPYIPNNDSIFLAFKDKRSYYVHLDGRIIYAFPDDQFALTPRLGYWSSQKLLQSTKQMNDGKLKVELIDPRTSTSILQGSSEMKFLDRDHVSCFASNKYGSDSYKVFSAPSFQEQQFSDERLSLQNFEPIFLEGNYYWIVQDVHLGTYGIMDPSGNILLPIHYPKFEFPFVRKVKYPIIETTERAPFITFSSFDPCGRLLYGGSTFLFDGKMPHKKYYFSAADFPVPQNLIYTHFTDSFDEYYPNHLKFVSQTNKKGKDLGRGYIDIYGQVYF